MKQAFTFPERLDLTCVLPRMSAMRLLAGGHGGARQRDVLLQPAGEGADGESAGSLDALMANVLTSVPSRAGFVKQDTSLNVWPSGKLPKAAVLGKYATRTPLCGAAGEPREPRERGAGEPASPREPREPRERKSMSK